MVMISRAYALLFRCNHPQSRGLSLFPFYRSGVLDQASGVGLTWFWVTKMFVGRDCTFNYARKTDIPYLFDAQEHLLRPPTPKESQEQFARRNAVNMLMTVPGLGSVNISLLLYVTHIDFDFRQKSAEALYDDGCDTIEKLHLEKYKEKLAPRPRKSLKYVKYLGSLVPRENAQRIVVRCRSSQSLRSQPQDNLYRRFARISYHWMDTKSSSLVTSKSVLATNGSLGLTS